MGGQVHSIVKKVYISLKTTFGHCKLVAAQGKHPWKQGEPVKDATPRRSSLVDTDYHSSYDINILSPVLWTLKITILHDILMI